jgi:hypothetical protein
VYTTCAFCNAKLDGDGGPSGLGVGRRIAFDEWKGRLWVICGKCSRWNLTPWDDRLERIEALARTAIAGRITASTEQIALIRWAPPRAKRGERYDFVRVGKPPRIELASWRYGERLAQRARDRAKITVPLAVAAVGIGIAANVVAGGGLGVLVWNLHSFTEAMYVNIVGRRRVNLVEPPSCARCGTLMQLRAKHVQHARLVPETRADLAVLVSCPHCHQEGAMVTGETAAQILRQGLTYLNATRTGRRSAGEAAQTVDQAGGADNLIRDVARRELTLRALRPGRRLALEMAVDEQTELLELERQWREAEELADIADGTLSTTAEVEEKMKRLRGPEGNQLSG